MAKVNLFTKDQETKTKKFIKSHEMVVSKPSSKKEETPVKQTKIIKNNITQINLFAKERGGKKAITSFEIDRTDKPIVMEDAENFTAESIYQGVKLIKKDFVKSPKKRKKRFILTVVSTMMMMQRMVTSSTLGSPMTAFANSTAVPVNGSATEVTVTLIQSLLDLMKTILPQFQGIAVALATLLLVIVGIMIMFRKNEYAVGWIQDIIKGLIQILIAPMLVALIYYATATLLGDFSTFSTFLK